MPVEPYDLRANLLEAHDLLVRLLLDVSVDVIFRAAQIARAFNLSASTCALSGPL